MSFSLILNIFDNFFLLFLSLNLNRSPLAGNDISNCCLYVDHCHTQHGYNPYHSLEKNKKTLRKMFSETNFMEQDSSKNRLALVKTNCVSKHMLSAKKLCRSYYEYKKAPIRTIIPSYISYAFEK